MRDGRLYLLTFVLLAVPLPEACGTLSSASLHSGYLPSQVVGLIEGTPIANLGYWKHVFLDGYAPGHCATRIDVTATCFSRGCIFEEFGESWEILVKVAG